MQLIQPVFIKPPNESCTIKHKGADLVMYNHAVGLHLTKMILVEDGYFVVSQAYGLSDNIPTCESWLIRFVFISGYDQHWFFNTESEARAEYDRIIDEY